MKMKGVIMNLLKQRNYTKPAYMLIVLLLSGCNLLPEKSTEDAINNAKEYSSEKDLSTYKQQIDEMLAMRTSINRLVELEGDLTFLLDEMSRFEEQNPNLEFAQKQTGMGELNQKNEVVYSPNGITGKAQEGGMDTSKFNAPSDLESLELAISQAKEQTVLRVNRFSDKNTIVNKPKVTVVETTAAQKLNSDLPGVRSEQVSNDKFSRAPISALQQAKSIVGPILVDKNITCDDITTNASNSFAVHLASYSSQKSAITAWKRIMSEYKGELCSDIARTQTVTVKGKIYYRLNVGGYVDKSFAQTVCTKLTKRSTYCKVVEFKGDMI
jgi:hypothetical protein